MRQIAKNVNIEKIDKEQLLTSSEVGALLQVNPSSVNKWVSQGRITAFRTPGGHRRIRAADLVAFLELHDMPIPDSLRSASRRRVLIVDDDRAQLKALERLLKPFEKQLHLMLVDNGIDALVQVGAQKPNLVILDVFMPELDGLEVCRRLKANVETKDIDVVVTSAQLTSAIKETALEAGAIRCMSKPLHLPDLVELLLLMDVEAEV